MTALTKKQKKITKDLDEIFELLALDYHNTAKSKDLEGKTALLELNKNQIIRSEVIMNYTFIDEFLNSIIGHYYFGKKKTFLQLWKTKKFQRFNYFILEKLYLLNKLELAKEIEKLPKSIEIIIRKTNDLRNALAHSFFPENLRTNKATYNGKSIFKNEVFKEYHKDAEKVTDYFFSKIFK